MLTGSMISEGYREMSETSKSMRFSDGSGALGGIILGKFLEMSLGPDL